MEGTPVHLSIDFATGTTSLSENDLEKISPPSAMPWQTMVEVLDLERLLVPGIRVLDIGGGGSDFTAHLLELGIDAYSVDPKYRSRSEIYGKINAQLNSGHYDKQSARERRTSLDVFRDSLRSHPERYKAATASALPFPDNFFDLVVSMAAVTAYLDVDRDVCQAAMAEAVRVCRKEFRCAPFGNEEPQWPAQINQIRAQNDRYIRRWLTNNPKVFSVRVEDTSSERVSRLCVVTK